MLQALAEHRERENNSRLPLSGRLPDEVQALPFWRETLAGKLTARLGAPFWQVHRPQKNERCLYISCGPSFLTDPWVEWGALFWGTDLDGAMVRAVRARAPQLNSKLFKDLQEAPPHDLDRYPEGQFDLVIAAGFSPFMPLAYSEAVIAAVRRVLKVGGGLLWEVADPDSSWFEDWSIGQIYLGLEVVAVPLADWKRALAAVGPIQAENSGELLHTFLVERA
ncbi:class I SAM-dependent methyltransferase [Gloeobacter violaceus]|uniref:Glr2921 protein n=1 Tax=Gloeobacter violaceus (strain ATCC 29082 / PCC 7421) TaxID=251221 RepID=Q7NCQ7_GLOVI|nr:class I SAM-dependent methyltransferase [Gloeobacter violaceus]BAC90862.1 glr2921 [Gloeobacter violaceus PCC 7421]